LARRGLDAVDVIVDPVGGPLRADSPEGAGAARAPPGCRQRQRQIRRPIGANQLWLSNAGVLGFNVGGLLTSHPERGTAAARRALELLAAGRITTVHDALPLDRAAEAHRRLEAGGLSGRIILTVDQSATGLGSQGASTP
jgi:NADPH2:quinone reductase